MRTTVKEKTFANILAGPRVRQTTHRQSPIAARGAVFSQCPCDGGCPGCTNGGVIQPKLTIGQPNDKYEQEADRVADLVMRMPETRIQRAAACTSCDDFDEEDRITPLVQRQVEEEEEEEEPVQMKSLDNKSPSNSLPRRIQSIKGGGQPLSHSIRAFFEPRFGRDFSHVRVHTDANAVEAAKSLNAKAFTTGTNVVFGIGQFSPGTTTGKHLLAHELGHVIQQNGAMKGVVQRQIYRDCTPTRTGQPGVSQTDVDNQIQLNMQHAHHLVSFAVQALDDINNGRGTADQQNVLQAHFGVLTNSQIGTLLSRFGTIHGRLNNPDLIICNSAGSFYCRPPRGWCAYNTCPAPNGYTHLCPPFFEDPYPCTEPNRTMALIHEAAHAVGACDHLAQPGAGYPPSNAMDNVYSYSGFTREIARLMMPQPALTPPPPPPPEQPSLIEGIIRDQERRMRERIIESAEDI